MDVNYKASKAIGISLSQKESENASQVVVEIPSQVTSKETKVDSQQKEPTDSSIGFVKPRPDSASPEMPQFAPTPNKPPKIPSFSGTLTPRKSFSRSAYSKPKSRFGEQPYHIDSDIFEENHSSFREQIGATSSRRASPGHKSASSALNTPRAQQEEEDDEEIYKKVQLSREKHKKVKLKTLIKWVGVFCIIGCLVASLTVKRLSNCFLWGLEIWKWCMLATVILCGMMFTNWVMHVIVFLIERNFLLRKKVLYFVHGLKKSVQVTLWLTVVLATWASLFERKNQRISRSRIAVKILDAVTWTLVSLLIGAFLWLIKTLLLKILASKFHMNRFFDRIQESIFHQYVLQTLSGPPSVEEAERIGKSSSGQMSFRSKKGKQADHKKVIDMGRLHQMKREKVSAWTMKELVDAVTCSELSTISQTLDESYQNAGAEVADGEITSEMEAIAAAFKIFNNVALPGNNFIEEEDLRRFMIKEEVDHVLPLFEGAGAETRQIDKKALTDWVVKVYQGRKALAHALKDTKTAVKQLNNLVTALLIIVTAVVWLLLMEIATTKVLVFLLSQVALAIFMFGNTCKNIFEALIFVFVMHPFDVGDRCVVDGVPLLVEEMNILTTVFLKLSNEKVYYPNSVLATKAITNYYRSPDMSDTIEFSIGFMTPLERIGAMKERIKRYLEKNPQHWHPNHNVVVKEIEDVNKIKIALYANHTMNFQEWAEKNRRRTELVMELKKIFEELKINYSLLAQTVHLVPVETETITEVHRRF